MQQSTPTDQTQQQQPLPESIPLKTSETEERKTPRRPENDPPRQYDSFMRVIRR